MTTSEKELEYKPRYVTNVNTIRIGLQTMTWETKELEPLNMAAAARDQAKAELVFNVAEKQDIKARIISLEVELEKLQATLKEIHASLDMSKVDYQALKSDMRLFCKELAIKYEANALINSYWCDADKVDIVILFKDVKAIVGLMDNPNIDLVNLLLDNLMHVRGNVGHIFKFGSIATNLKLAFGL